MSPLTQREREVVHLLAWGLKLKEIAKILSITLRTCKGHVETAKVRTGLNSSLALILELHKGNPNFTLPINDAVKRRPKFVRMDITGREKQVLKLLAEGYTVKQIASLLTLSVKTVETHKFNLMRKLDIHNRTELICYAVGHGIIAMGFPGATVVITPGPSTRA